MRIIQISLMSIFSILGISDSYSQNINPGGAHYTTKQINQLHDLMEQAIVDQNASKSIADAARYRLEAFFESAPFLNLPDGQVLDLGPVSFIWIPAIILIITIIDLTAEEAVAPEISPVPQRPALDCSSFNDELRRAMRRVTKGRHPGELNCEYGSTDPACQLACTVMSTFQAFVEDCPYNGLAQLLRYYNNYFHCAVEI